MGSFHGRRKPSAKKPSKPKGDSAEDIAARQARDQFIKDMAAKAPPPPEDVDAGGIHPSRLGRTGQVAGGHSDNVFSGRQGPARGQRAPDLRQQNKKRTFDDATSSAGGPIKKQRTLQEIRKLKGPAAMQKEEEKRRKQATVKDTAAQETENTTGGASKSQSDQIDEKAKDTSDVAREKAQRKADKAARKAAKQLEANTTRPIQIEDVKTESKEARKERRKAEKAAKAALAVDAGTDTTIAELEKDGNNNAIKEKKEQKKERKRLAKLAALEPTDDSDHKRKKEKKVKSENIEKEHTMLHSSTTAWAQAASALGTKSSKFLKLMGAAKAGSMIDAPNTASKSMAEFSRNARRAEKELETQYTTGMQAKQSGSKRGGLGA